MAILRQDKFMENSFSKWHQYVETQNVALLDEILADEVRFHSPFVWKSKDGKLITMAILTAVTTVFEEFRYVREILDGNNWALEFEAKVGDFNLRGIDLIQVNDDGLIIDFEVMIRPANALQAVGIAMNKKLAEQGMI